MSMTPITLTRATPESGVDLPMLPARPPRSVARHDLRGIVQNCMFLLELVHADHLHHNDWEGEIVRLRARLYREESGIGTEDELNVTLSTAAAVEAKMREGVRE